MRDLLYIVSFLLSTIILSNCTSNNTSNEKVIFNTIVELEISDSNYNLLKSYRDSAIQLGIISPNLKKSIKGNLKHKGELIPIKLRFKGDWIDHLKGDKWSFRISVLGDNSFNGLKSFSIQSPQTRSFLDEWLIHKIFNQEDVLTTRYEFIDVKLNGKNLGIYAYEEHFEKQLIENNRRREGPIVKFNEEGLWETRIKKEFYNISFPYYESSEIVPFKKNKTLKKTNLKKNFDVATELMLNYKSLVANLNEVFDLEKAAKYFALCDLARVRHSLHWHNQRFYFNPITNKLEHIGFDCFAGFDEGEKDIIYGYLENDKYVNDIHLLNKQFYNSNIFKTYYYDYLKKYSSKEFINNLKLNYSDTAKYLVEMLNTEFPNYNFNLNKYQKNAKLIDSLLPIYKTKEYKYHLQKRDYSQLDTIGEYYFPSIGLKATWQNNRKNEVLIKNYHFTSVEIIGYLNADSKVIPFKKHFSEKLVLNKYKLLADSTSILLDSNALAICFIPKNTNKMTFRKIQYWKYNSTNLPTLKALKSSLKNIPSVFRIDKSTNKVILENGNYTFNKNIIIPQGWTLEFKEGTTIQLNNSCYILSYSPILFLGTNTDPISINNGALFVLGSKKDTSKMSHVNFENCRLDTQSNWTLTGAITFYNTNLEIKNCSFSNNKSEDALNLISSTFILKNSTIKNTLSDGFDADFCDGFIDNCIFYNTKNDGVDISGSNVTISNSKLSNIKDKAISSGENSILVVKNCSIDSANIGLASKDKSRIKADNINVSNTNVCYAVFQKKAEYNPASIDISNNFEEKYKTLYLIDYKSILKINNNTIIGSKHVNVDSLYIPFK